jgi:uncharacterized protein (DUF924 family)
MHYADGQDADGHGASPSADTPDDARRLVAFWEEAGPACWFTRNDAFDAQCAQYLPLHLSASRRELEHWSATATGALALLLLLDQIPRNAYRDSAHAYATDGLARRYAEEAVQAGFDARIDPMLRVFFYLPFEHSESIDDQRRSLELHTRLEGKDASHWARLHYELIERFGRFPHRNATLGRTTTAEEQTYLDAGGFAG